MLLSEIVKPSNLSAEVETAVLHTFLFTAALAIQSPGSMQISPLYVLYTTWPWLLECCSLHVLCVSYTTFLSWQAYLNICSVESLEAYLLWIIYSLTNWCIVASKSVELPDNCQLVRVLPFRTISGERNTQWFMLFFHIWIVVITSAVIVLSLWKVGRRKKGRR